MISEREKTKILIEISETVEQADETIREYLGEEKTLGEKMAFLHGMFNIKFIGHEETVDDATYWAMLSTIINQKYC